LGACFPEEERDDRKQRVYDGLIHKKGEKAFCKSKGTWWVSKKDPDGPQYLPKGEKKKGGGAGDKKGGIKREEGPTRRPNRIREGGRKKRGGHFYWRDNLNAYRNQKEEGGTRTGPSPTFLRARRKKRRKDRFGTESCT